MSSRGGKSKASKVAPSLVALGSAAVLTIYAAGYLKTRSASEQFEPDGAARRISAPPEGAPVLVPAAPPVRDAQAASTGEETPASSVQAGRLPGPAAANRPASRAALSEPVAAPSVAVVAPDVAATPGAPALSGPPVAEQAVEAAASSTSAPGSTAAPSPAESEARTAQSAAAPAPAPPPLYKDGTYTGWGTSRHGDIQATVVVDGGRIASAAISRCLTRYSCSWIAMLPGQVVTRQSPEVDYVSGATQSTNAFYYAVVEALSKAK